LISKFLKTQKISFDTETEQALKHYGCGQKRKIDATITTEYEQLLAALQKKVKRHYYKTKKKLKG
jgi:carboxyl-terminal processing protease